MFAAACVGGRSAGSRSDRIAVPSACSSRALAGGACSACLRGSGGYLELVGGGDRLGDGYLGGCLGACFGEHLLDLGHELVVMLGGVPLVHDQNGAVSDPEAVMDRTGGFGAIGDFSQSILVFDPLAEL